MESSEICSRCGCEIGDAAARLPEGAAPICGRCASGEDASSQPPPGLWDAIEQTVGDDGSADGGGAGAAPKLESGDLTPDETVSVPVGDCPDYLSDRIVALLNGRVAGEPLLFRSWPPKGARTIAVVAAVVVAAGFFGLAGYYAFRPEFAMLARRDIPLALFLSLGLAGVAMLVMWPVCKGWLENQRGFQFGDYVMDFGYIEARPTEVTIRAWESVSVETGYDSDEPVNISTAGGFDIPIEKGFEGDRYRAEEVLGRYDRGEMPAEVRGLFEDDEVYWVESFTRLKHSFVAPLGAGSLVAALVAGFGLAGPAQSFAQSHTADGLVVDYDETIERLGDHDREAVDEFRGFVELCNREIEAALTGDDAQPEEGSPPYRLETEICDRLSYHRPLTRFSHDAMYGYLAIRSDTRHEEVLRERLRGYYQTQRAELVDRLGDDPDDHGQFALGLLDTLVDNPGSPIDLQLQPVVSIEFENLDLLVELFGLDTPGAMATDGDPEDPGEHQLYGRDRARLVSPTPYVTGEEHLNITAPAHGAVDRLFEALFEETDFRVDRSVGERKFSYELFEHEQFDDLDYADYATFDPHDVDLDAHEAYGAAYGDGGDGDAPVQKLDEQPDGTEGDVQPELDEDLFDGQPGESGATHGEQRDEAVEQTDDTAGVDPGERQADPDQDDETPDGDPEADEHDETTYDPDDFVVFDELVENPPQVHTPTVSVAYEVLPGDRIYESFATDNVYLALRIRFVVQWLDPKQGAVWSYDATVDPPDELWFGPEIDPDDPSQVYGLIYQKAFEQLTRQLEREVSL